MSHESRMATPGKATKKERKKPVPVKTSLNNPYDLKWKPLEKGHARFILKTVTEKLGSLDLRKRHVKVFRKWGSKRKPKVGNSHSVVDTAKPTQESNVRAGPDSGDNTEHIQESDERDGQDSMNTAESTHESKNQGGSHSVSTTEPTHEPQQRGWTNKQLRTEIAIGINEVTKALEKNELGLVLVCDSVNPAHMTSHLISLSQTRSVPACQVPGLSASLAGTLALTSVLALGFKRQSATFAHMIAALVPKVPPVGVAWVSAGTGVSKPEVLQVSGETDQQCEDDHAGKGRKRKLDDTSEVRKDSLTTLQPLKVKKVIPNPSKIRKPKIKKAKQK